MHRWPVVRRESLAGLGVVLLGLAACTWAVPPQPFALTPAPTEPLMVPPTLEHLIPKPVSVTATTGTFTLANTTHIYHTPRPDPGRHHRCTGCLYLGSSHPSGGHE